MHAPFWCCAVLVGHYFAPYLGQVTNPGNMGREMLMTNFPLRKLLSGVLKTCALTVSQRRNFSSQIWYPKKYTILTVSTTVSAFSGSERCEFVFVEFVFVMFVSGLAQGVSSNLHQIGCVVFPPPAGGRTRLAGPCGTISGTSGELLGKALNTCQEFTRRICFEITGGTCYNVSGTSWELLEEHAKSW